jgi:hypothetical protein
MTTSLNNGTAKIYQFPAGGRPAPGNHPRDETKSAADQSSPSVNAAACSGSWYHEAAIQESKPARER